MKYIAENVFSHKYSDWNKERERHEMALLKAAEDLLIFSGASSMELDLDGIRVTAARSTATGTIN